MVNRVHLYAYTYFLLLVIKFLTVGVTMKSFKPLRRMEDKYELVCS